jgi:AhpD family alkylhydroperoxidase
MPQNSCKFKPEGFSARGHRLGRYKLKTSNREEIMKTLLAAAAVAGLACGTAFAQDAPNFIKNTYPDYAIGEALGLMGALEGDNAAIDGKTMQLIQLGVAAQIPCTYCVYYHTKAAMAAGATQDEIKAAIAAAADTRMWSTVLNGSSYDLDAFKSEVDGLMSSN